jgi:hypothetical protein
VVCHHQTAATQSLVPCDVGVTLHHPKGTADTSKQRKGMNKMRHLQTCMHLYQGMVAGNAC